MSSWKFEAGISVIWLAGAVVWFLSDRNGHLLVGFLSLLTSLFYVLLAFLKKYVHKGGL